MINFESSKQLDEFLTEEAKRLNFSKRNLYKIYFARELLKRIAYMDKNHSLVVKGSLAQLTHLKKLTRSITDIDLTISTDDIYPFMAIINALNSKKDDIKYESDSIFRTYTGTYKIPVNIRLGKMTHYIGIDYKEDNPFIFERQEKTVPKIFTGDEEYSVVVPSLEETIAEKLCIIMKCNKDFAINTRIKDFYDIYNLYGGEFDLDKFSYYFEKFLIEEGKIDMSTATTDHLSKNYIKRHKNVWQRKKENFEFVNDIELEGAVYYTKSIIDNELKKQRQSENKCYIFGMTDDKK